MCRVNGMIRNHDSESESSASFCRGNMVSRHIKYVELHMRRIRNVTFWLHIANSWSTTAYRLKVLLGCLNITSNELKELAKRFALTFGFDPIKNCEPIIALHRAGILFAVCDVPEDPVAAPKRLLFFEVLNKFNHKLLKQDKKVILNFMDRRISPGKPEEYQPLTLYRNSLVHGETDEAPMSSKRAYARKRRDHNDYEEEHNDPDYRG